MCMQREFFNKSKVCLIFKAFFLSLSLSLNQIFSVAFPAKNLSCFSTFVAFRGQIHHWLPWKQVHGTGLHLLSPGVTLALSPRQFLESVAAPSWNAGSKALVCVCVSGHGLGPNPAIPGGWSWGESMLGDSRDPCRVCTGFGEPQIMIPTKGLAFGCLSETSDASSTERE